MRSYNTNRPSLLYQRGGNIKKAYSPTTAANDKGFQEWYKNNTWEAREGKPYSDKLFYDFYSFYKSGDYKNPEFSMYKHFPDTYKRPTHPTFSNESIYSTPENPGGSWKGEVFIPYVKKIIKGQLGMKTSSTSNYVTGQPVKYGTPEYRDAYNRGEVVTKQGVRSPILLDEVVINRPSRDKNWLVQYKDKIVAENKDAGPLGAIIGTPISAIASIPQLLATKILTGKMVRPSEAMEIKNQYGAIAADAVLDPLALAGTGILTKDKIISTIAQQRILPKSVLQSGVGKYKIPSISESIGKYRQYTPAPEANLDPYISKRVFNDTKGQHVFESAFPPEAQAKMIEQRTTHYDASGNITPPPVNNYKPFKEDEYLKMFNLKRR
jgi:hypothetical protein